MQTEARTFFGPGRGTARGRDRPLGGLGNLDRELATGVVDDPMAVKSDQKGLVPRSRSTVRPRATAGMAGQLRADEREFCGAPRRWPGGTGERLGFAEGRLDDVKRSDERPS